jgi:hypothetical protein
LRLNQSFKTTSETHDRIRFVQQRRQLRSPEWHLAFAFEKEEAARLLLDLSRVAAGAQFAGGVAQIAADFVRQPDRRQQRPGRAVCTGQRTDCDAPTRRANRHRSDGSSSTHRGPTLAPIGLFGWYRCCGRAGQQAGIRRRAFADRGSEPVDLSHGAIGFGGKSTHYPARFVAHRRDACFDAGQSRKNGYSLGCRTLTLQKL